MINLFHVIYMGCSVFYYIYIYLFLIFYGIFKLMSNNLLLVSRVTGN